MRSTTFSSLAVLAASLLVKDVLAGPIRIRGETVMVEVMEEVVVEKMPDGSLHTEAASVVKTVTSVPTETVAPVSASTASAQVFAQKAPATEFSSPAKTTAEASPSPAPTTLIAKPSSASSSASAVPTTPATTSSAAAVPTTPATTTSSGGKRGLAFNDASLLTKFTSAGSFDWAYNWASSGGTMPQGVEYVPLLWSSDPNCPKGDFTKSWKANADKAIANGAKHLLADNEPDNTGQANITPEVAIAGWNAQMAPYASKAKLGSPAVSNGVGTNSAGITMGLDWLKEFTKSVDPDFMVIHWYSGSAASVSDALADFKKHCGDAKAAFPGKPIWITEFQYIGPGDSSDFVKQVVDFLEAPDQSYVERYSYFMVADGSLLANGGLSAAGKSYVAPA